MTDSTRECLAARFSNARPFFGFAPLFAWHFCFWFAPNSMPSIDLLSDAVTFTWIIYLAASVIALVGAAAALRNRRRLSSISWLALGAPALLTVLSAAFSYNLFAAVPAVHFAVVPALLGAVESFCFLLWGEHYARHRITGSSATVMVATAATTLALLGIVRLLPAIAAAALIALLPLASGIMMAKQHGTLARLAAASAAGRGGMVAVATASPVVRAADAVGTEAENEAADAESACSCPAFESRNGAAAGGSGAAGRAAANTRADSDAADPVLKPAAMRRRAMRNILIVGGVSFVVSTACFHLLTIIPKASLMGGQWGYCYGVMVGTAFMLVMVAALSWLGRDDNPFRMLPWLLTTVIVALSVHLGLGHPADSFSFFFTTAVYSSFELLLMVYFVIVAQKGGASSAIALGISLGLFRLGVLCGNSLALALEFRGMEDSLIAAVIATVSLCAVAVLMVPFISEGRYIEKLTAKAPDVGEAALSAACAATAREFGLSPRESEVLGFLAHGYTAANIADKMVISEYTVRAHTRHIYEKTHMHKRSELIGYIKDQMAHFEP